MDARVGKTALPPPCRPAWRTKGVLAPGLRECRRFSACVGTGAGARLASAARASTAARRGAGPRPCADSGGRVGPRQLLRVQRHASRSASAAGPDDDAAAAYVRAAAMAPRAAERDFFR